MLFIGGLQAYTIVWDLGDVGIGLITIINLITLIPMSKEAISLLDKNEARLACYRVTNKSSFRVVNKLIRPDTVSYTHLPTSRLSGVRSNHLSYEPKSWFIQKFTVPFEPLVEISGIEPVSYTHLVTIGGVKHFIKLSLLLCCLSVGFRHIQLYGI